MGGKPENGYKCDHCGSSAHYGRSNKCPAKSVFCRNCKKRGHYTQLCKNPRAPKRRQPASFPNAAAKRQKQEFNNVNEININAFNVLPKAGPQPLVKICAPVQSLPALQRRRSLTDPSSNTPPDASSDSVQPMLAQNPPIIPTPLIPKSETLHDWTIGNRPSRYKIDETTEVNILSESEHMRLLNLNVVRVINKTVEKLSIGNNEFKRILVTHVKLANGTRTNAIFFIRKGTEGFAMITTDLAEELKISSTQPIQNNS